MRSIPLLLAAAALTSCSTAPPEPAPMTQRGMAQLQRLTEGRVAGATQTCIPNYPNSDFWVIDENRVAFRSGSTIYVNNLNGPCSRLGWGGYAFVTRHPGGSNLCRGEIATVVDTSSGFTVGSCTLGDFIPYARR